MKQRKRGERGRERKGTERGGKEEGNQGGESEAQAVACTPQELQGAKVAEPPGFAISVCCMDTGFLLGFRNGGVLLPSGSR